MISTPRDLVSATIASRIAYWFLLVGAVVDGLALIVRCFSGPWLPMWWEMFHVVIRAGTALAFLSWVYDRYRSLPRIGWSPDHTPFAAVAWFFVPLLNFYRPYLVVEEMWSATDPQQTTEVGRSRTVLRWWLLLLTAPLLAFLVRPLHAFGFVVLDLVVAVLIDAINIAAAILAMRLILLIDERWRRKAVIFAAQQKRAAMTAAPPPVAAPPVVAPVAAPAPVVAPVPRPVAPPPPPPLPSRPVARPPVEPLQSLVPVPEVNASLRVMMGAATIISWLGVAHLVLVVILCIVRGFGSISAPAPFGAITRLVILMLIFGAVLGFIPSIHLMRFASATSRFLKSNNGVDLEALLVMQGRFWRYIGGIAAVMLSFYFFTFFVNLMTGALK